MPDHGIAIVGCGMIADFHAKAINELPNARVVLAASRSEGNAKRVAEIGGGDATTDYTDVYARDDVDIVDVCTPSGAHMEIAVEAAKAGKHVVVEKPLEVTLERCDAIIEACEANSVTSCVIFPSRWGDMMRVVKGAIDDGRFGRLTLGDAQVKWWRTQEYYGDGWHGTQKLDGGGALMNQSSHTIDILQWFMGPVKRIQAFKRALAHPGIEVEDVAVAALEFENGALGMIEGTTAAFPGLSRWIGVHGDQGSAIIEDSNLIRWEFADQRPEDAEVVKRHAPKGKGAGAADPAAISHEGHRRQLADFLADLDAGRPPLINAREGRKAVEIIVGIYRSADAGGPVDLPL